MSDTRSTDSPGDEEVRAAAHYRRLLATHGDSWRTLDWGSPEGQARRFAVLAEGLQLEGQRILDVGCGLGHFADWLAQQGVACSYTGLDLTPELVLAAAARHPHHTFVHGSLLDSTVLPDGRFDVVVSSGVFCSYPEGGRAWMQAGISRLWAWSSNAIAFNSLSTWAPNADPGEYHADPLDVLAFCANLSSRVALRHDYHPRDFTVHVYRTAAG
jgi:SAM-dependent methyltransferase